MKHYFKLVVLVAMSISLNAQEAHVTAYIEEYKEVAISEMLRTGVPASIKLAQGILESDAGRSDLACNSNNHFGIKCGPTWDGGTFYKKDDDRDRRGRLIKSCFRVFSSPQESFQAHSEFLLNPNKAYRYGFLFTLDCRDYKSWAWGLKESGYATNPRYAVLLISIIERYQLYQFDYYEKTPGQLAVFQQPPSERQPRMTRASQVIKPKVITTSWKAQGTDHLRVIKGKVTNNGLQLVYAQQDDTPRDLADRFHVSVDDLIAYNEGIHHTHQKLVTADRVYLEKKKKKYLGASSHHVVLQGETMYEIAQIYGLRLEPLLKRNRLKIGQEPIVGERISLRKKIKKRDRPALHVPKLERQPPVEKDRRVVSNSNHIVRAGDTLYSIAKRYKLSVDQLKDSNDLVTSLIVPGQVLNVGNR